MYASNTASRGYIALLSVIILGFVFLLAVISAAEFGISGRLLLLTLENKARSEEHAEACVQLARVQVVSDPTVTVSNSSIASEDVACTIVSLTHSGGQSTITSTAEVSGATTNFRVVVDSSTADVISWQEQETLP